MRASRRDVLIAGACGATALGAGVVTAMGGRGDEVLAAPLEQLVPGKVGAWMVQPAASILIPRGDTEELETYDQIVTRVYENSAAAPVMLLVAYGNSQAGTTQLHRPEVCYPAAGFVLEDRATLQLPVASGGAIDARTLTATAPGRVEQILYWSRIGRDFPRSTLDQRWSMLRQTLRGAVPDGALVRMSVIAPDYRAALPVLVAFAKGLLAAPAASQRLFTGLA